MVVLRQEGRCSIYNSPVGDVDGTSFVGFFEVEDLGVVLELREDSTARVLTSQGLTGWIYSWFVKRASEGET
jgi:hypothetical protein